MQAISRTQTGCQHCGLPVLVGEMFCCRGCESVHALLVERGLSHFYALRDQFSFQKPDAGTEVRNVQQSISRWEPLQGKKSSRFYLEGIHCLGCLWLLEKLPELDSQIQSTSLDIAHQILEIRVNKENADWGSILSLIAQLGYTAKPITSDTANTARLIDLRWQLSRIGVAAFAAGNIMLLSVSIYAGTDAFWGIRFGWISFLLAIPCLSFSAWPLYKAALYPLRKGQLSADLAIVLALLAGTLMSTWSLLSGTESLIYFDSLTMLVFLLLSSRFILSRFRESLSKESPCLSFLSGERYRRFPPDGKSVAPDSLQPGNKIELLAGQTLPADSTLLSAESYFDLSLLTGESTPAKFLLGDRIEAGSKLLSPRVAVQVEHSVSESRLARIMEQIRSYQIRRTPAIEFADRMGRYFVVISLAAAATLLVLFPGEEGWKRALALVIVTCPCVLAFAVPLALVRASQRAAQRGILFISPEKMEELAAVRNFFFDKTGTLTTGQFEVKSWVQLRGDILTAKRAVLALESRSSHPVAKAVVRFTNAAAPALTCENFQEIPGYGVSGDFLGSSWKIGHHENGPAEENSLEVRCDGELVALITLGDAVRPESYAVIEELKKSGATIALLSGDQESRVASIASSLGVSTWRSKLLPEEKAKIVSQVSHSAMIGDGANDAIAFRGAAIGIAVQGAVDVSLKSSDIVLTKPGLTSVVDAVKLAKSTMRIVRTNFAITLAYNLFAGTLAACGLMAPLWAAVIMPASALSVFVLTQWQTGRRSI